MLLVVRWTIFLISLFIVVKDVFEYSIIPQGRTTKEVIMNAGLTSLFDRVFDWAAFDFCDESAAVVIVFVVIVTATTVE